MMSKSATKNTIKSSAKKLQPSTSASMSAWMKLSGKIDYSI